MEKIQKEIEALAGNLLLTNFDNEPEPYILTHDEEEAALSHEIERFTKYAKWKLNLRPLPEEEKLFKLEQLDFAKAINREEILRKANSNKLYVIWQQQQREKEIAEFKRAEEELKKTWTARQMLHLMRWTSKNKFGKDLSENEHTLPLIKAVCFFLSNDPRFETELKYSFTKGLMIRGISGTGKTHTISCVAENPLTPILIVSMLDIADEVKFNGDYEIPRTGWKKLYLDDVGAEVTMVNHYGTKINWFNNFIQTFYLRNRDYSKLICSTNNSAMQFEELYGFRVRSRIKDMFNIIDVIGTDLRGQ